MAGINLVVVQGNLGQDPELRYTQGGEPVANLSLATSEQWVDKSGEKKERTEWHRIIVWGKQAENCTKFLAKGHKCSVIGKLQTRSWDDKQGVKRYTTEIVAREVQFLGAPQGGGNRPPSPSDTDRPLTHSSMPHGDDPGPSPALDDIPF